MPFLLWLLVASTLNPVFSHHAKTSKKTPPMHPASHTVLLPVTEGPRLAQGKTKLFWIPSKADLRKLERDMPRSVRGYYRQYLGIIENGKRLILINGFSPKVAKDVTGGKHDWHSHAVVAMDGGTLFFKATYNPHTRRFVGPTFNGLG